MTYFQAIALGLLQGLTEFLPVSSTAHMDIAPQLLFHMADPGAAFSAIAQMGPIVAIIIYFREDLKRYVQGILRTKSPANLSKDDLDARLGWYVLFGTIPIIIFGLVLEKKIDNDFRNLQYVAVALIALSLVLAYAEYVSKRKKELVDMTFGESQVISWLQVLALVPGASRSGVTITAGLLQGYTREAAARFSFLLSIPAITAAGLYKLAKVAKDPSLHAQIGPYLVAAVVAGVFAYVVIKWFLGYMREHNTMWFVVYRIVLGVLILFLLHGGYIHNMPPKSDSSTTANPSAISTTEYVPDSDGHFAPAQGSGQ